MTVHIVDRVHGHDGARAIRVEGGRIVEIGTTKTTTDADTIVHQGVMLPGLRDSHIHPLALAAAGSRLDVSHVRSIAELVSELRTRVDQTAVSAPILAIGLDDERLAEGRMPTAGELDLGVGARPALVYRHCSHVASASSAALEAAGIGTNTEDPVGGRIRRNADGSAHGILEEAGIGAVASVLTARGGAPDTATLLSVLGGLRRRGVVAIDAMAGVAGSMWCVGGDEVDSLIALGRASPVAIDVYVICETAAQLRSAATRLEAAEGPIRFAGWKGFADGSLGGRTAALRSPYSDDASTSGILVGDRLEEMAEAAVELGGRVAIHAIGDRAVERSLEVAAALEAGKVRVEHASVADPDQVARMAEQGVIASIQPSFATADAAWIERRLGSERAAWAYPFADMRTAGIEMRGGSDAPIESSDPFVGIGDVCRPSGQALDPVSGLDLYAAHPLVVGAPATFLICDHHPSEVDVGEISAISVREVWIEDRRVE
ncbi:MAG TPA: amidohydrolase family protein [Acidimicrobiia bacterium]|nr:amidohydrolase family protein [Acidimicrobiia bacterium]